MWSLHRGFARSVTKTRASKDASHFVEIVVRSCQVFVDADNRTTTEQTGKTWQRGEDAGRTYVDERVVKSLMEEKQKGPEGKQTGGLRGGQAIEACRSSRCSPVEG